MKKFLFFILFSGFSFGQTIKEIEVLNKIKGTDIKKVSMILGLKPSPESSTKLGLTSLYFKKGNFSYFAIEETDNDKAENVYIVSQGENKNEKWLELSKDFLNDKAYSLVSFKYEMGKERENFLTLEDILKHMQKWDILDDRAIVYATFERNNQRIELQSVYNKVLYIKLK